jgi:hypothetical protein
MSFQFSKFQLGALFVFSTLLFAFGMFVLFRDIHIVGEHSNWNRTIGGLSLAISLCLMFPLQMAMAFKLIRENVPLLFGFRKGEIPPPTPEIKPGTPVPSIIKDEEEKDDSTLKG